MSSLNEKITARRPKPYDLPRHKQQEAWFYTNKGSIDLVVYDSGKTVQYRFRLRDMEKIVRDLRRNP
jgi:hypothetical protein